MNEKCCGEDHPNCKHLAVYMGYWCCNLHGHMRLMYNPEEESCCFYYYSEDDWTPRDDHIMLGTIFVVLSACVLVPFIMWWIS